MYVFVVWIVVDNLVAQRQALIELIYTQRKRKTLSQCVRLSKSSSFQTTAINSKFLASERWLLRQLQQQNCNIFYLINWFVSFRNQFVFTLRIATRQYLRNFYDYFLWMSAVEVVQGPSNHFIIQYHNFHTSTIIYALEFCNQVYSCSLFQMSNLSLFKPQLFA